MKSACAAFLLALVLPLHAAPIPVTGAHRDADGVTFQMQSGVMRVQVCTDRIIRVVYTPHAPLPKLENDVITKSWSPPRFFVVQLGYQTTLLTKSLQVRIDKSDGSIHFLNHDGKVLLEEPAGGGKSTPAVTINKEDAVAPTQAFLSPSDESIWGLGQHPQGTWNWRGMPYQLRQLDTDIALPVIVSSRGYGLLWDNASLTEFNPIDHSVPIDAANKSASFTAGVAGDYVFMAHGDAHKEIGIKLDGRDIVHIANPFVPYTVSASAHLDANQTVKLEIRGGGKDATLEAGPRPSTTTFRSQVGDAIDYTFFYGPKLDDVIAGYREATGPAPMWPEWAFGFWQCREHYESQQRLLDAAKGFRDRHIPVDLIIQDWHYWPEGLWGAYQWDVTRYPEPAAMIRQLHDENFHFMISTWSNPHGIAGDALTAAHLMIDKGNNFAELTNPAARAMRWDYVNKAFFSIGADGWWQDCTEPNDYSDIMEGRQFASGSGNRVRNAYSLFASQSTYEGQRAADPSKRVVILTRSAWPGIQRYGTGGWSADIQGDWQTFRAQVPNGLNFSLCGIPYWTTDTGGFFRPGDQTTDPNYNELLQRWFEWSTFCPILRIHGNQTETEMWKWPLAEKTLEAFDALRYRLLSYNYSVAWMTTNQGYTPMRALPFDFPGDARAAAIDDQFMSGPDLLVSPVTQQGATKRNVYLPAGTRWTDFWTGQSYDGGQAIEADAPIDRIPLHVRAGSILPFSPAVEYAAQAPAGRIIRMHSKNPAKLRDDSRLESAAGRPRQPLEIRVYPGADGQFTLYEDEGDNYNYEHGAHATIPFTWNESKHTLTIGAREGKFPGMLLLRDFRIIWVSPGHGVGVASDEAGQIVPYGGEPVSIRHGD